MAREGKLDLAHIRLPGAELIEQGLVDLAEQVESVASLLLLTAASRLSSLGIVLPKPAKTTLQPELKLYHLLSTKHGNGAHSKYNALRRRLSSYIRAQQASTSHHAKNRS